LQPIFHASLDEVVHDVVSALEAEFRNVREALTERLQRNYGKAYSYFLQWQAVSQVEQAVGIINRQPRIDKGRIRDVEVCSSDILEWLNLKQATFKGVRTVIRKGLLVLEGLQRHEESEEGWYAKGDAVLFGSLKAFFADSVIPDPVTKKAKLTQSDLQAVQWSKSDFLRMIDDLASRYQIVLPK
jgi:hypothetical protein